MKLDSLHDFYVAELKDLYNAENQLITLPKMAKAASSPQLRKAFESHLKETQGQVKRLEKVFKNIGIAPKGKKCKAMEGLLAEGKELMAEDAEPAVMDAALIAAAQRVEHYEMAGYGCVRTYARLLGDEASAELLQLTLNEEGAADKKLTELAESGINVGEGGGRLTMFAFYSNKLGCVGSIVVSLIVTALIVLALRAF